MGNNISNIFIQENKPIYVNNSFTTLNSNEIEDIRKRYKVIDVEWFDKNKVNNTIYNDEYFIRYPYKKKVLNDMVDYFITDKDKTIYKKKTNYLCNSKEQLCICNTHANDFRKIYDSINYKDKTYIAYIKKVDEPY